MLKVLPLLVLTMSASVLAQAVRPAPAPRPPIYTPGYSPETPPAPAHTPAGAGLPGERVPESAAVPRSPNKRVLPASGEPGVWAADGDPALTAPHTPNIGGVEIPYPANATTAKHRAATSFCGVTMTDALTEAKQRLRFHNLPPERQRCVAASLYRLCALALKETTEALRANGERTDEDVEQMKSTLWRAQAFETKECGGATLSSAEREMVDSTNHAWWSKSGKNWRRP